MTNSNTQLYLVYNQIKFVWLYFVVITALISDVVTFVGMWRGCALGGFMMTCQSLALCTELMSTTDWLSCKRRWYLSVPYSHLNSPHKLTHTYQELSEQLTGAGVNVCVCDTLRDGMWRS